MSPPSAAAAATSSGTAPPTFGSVFRYRPFRLGYTDAPPGWWRAFVLSTPPRTAKLAVVRADGSPHVVPVWVDMDGDDIVFMTSAETIKASPTESVRRTGV